MQRFLTCEASGRSDLHGTHLSQQQQHHHHHHIIEYAIGTAARISQTEVLDYQRPACSQQCGDYRSGGLVAAPQSIGPELNSRA